MTRGMVLGRGGGCISLNLPCHVTVCDHYVTVCDQVYVGNNVVASLNARGLFEIETQQLAP